MKTEKIVFQYGNLPKCRTNKLHLSDNKWVHFYIGEPWAYSSDKKIMLKEVYCFRDIEASGYVNVYVFYYKGKVYVLHSVTRDWTEYILNVYGNGTIDKKFIDTMVRCLEYYRNRQIDERYLKLEQRFPDRKYERKDITVIFLAEEVVTRYDGLDMNLYDESDWDVKILKKHEMWY